MVVLVTVAAGLMRAMADPRERLRALGIPAYLAGVLRMIVLIAAGRSAEGPAPRYTTLTVQLLCGAWVGCLPGPRRRWSEGLVAVAVLVPLVILFPANTRAAVARGQLRSSIHRSLVDDLRRGVPLAAIGQWYGDDFCPGENSVQQTLRTLARHHLGPFRGGTLVLVDRVPECEQVSVASASASAAHAAHNRTMWSLTGELPNLVLAVAPPRELCGLRLAVEVESTGLRGATATLRFTTIQGHGGTAYPREIRLAFEGPGRFERTVWVYGEPGRIDIRLDTAVTAFQVVSVTLLTPGGGP